MDEAKRRVEEKRRNNAQMVLMNLGVRQVNDVARAAEVLGKPVYAVARDEQGRDLYGVIVLPRGCVSNVRDCVKVTREVLGRLSTGGLLGLIAELERVKNILSKDAAAAADVPASPEGVVPNSVAAGEDRQTISADEHGHADCGGAAEVRV